ncbi:MAG: Rieske 2Fe-2S domain-containing protein [Ignavibacteria bacterium]|nr:Rieske 2Fe-2S domain-containing protein [Ignavibacteria bacterium]
MRIGEGFLINGKWALCVACSSEVKEGSGIRVVVGEDYNEQIAIFRYKSKLFCLSNICPHKHIDSLFRGVLKNGKISCPEHGWTYNLETGENLSLKEGSKRIKTFEVCETDGFVYVFGLKFDKPKWKDCNY